MLSPQHLDKMGGQKDGVLIGGSPGKGHFGAPETVSAGNPESSMGAREGSRYQDSKLSMMISQ